MKSKLVIVVLFLAAAAAVLWSVRARRPGGADPGATPQGRAEATEITVVFGTEKQAWLEGATAEFQRQNPDVRVALVGKGSIDAAQQILDGKLTPTVWSPADSLILSMLDSDWQTKHGAPLFGSGEDAPQPLVLTPLVFAIWDDRAQALDAADGSGVTWRAIHKAVSSPRGWPAVGGKPEWGFVKLGHTDPTRSNSGMQALLLLSLEYWNKTSGLQVKDLLDPGYQAFVAEVERGVTHFEPSTGTFMVDMVRFGPSKYDIAVVYENLVIEQIANAQGRWGNLRVYYPRVTLWSDHPAGVLQADWVTAAQRAAARRYLAFLRSRPVQERAVAHGFRPADPSVPVRTGDAQNPWNRLAQYGVKVDIPPVATPPQADVIRNLLTMWSRVVGQR
jgi:ABC-type molybdate transport system substrate-binding protein